MDKIALLFPGQGSQYVGMGKTLYDDYQIAKQTFKEANDFLNYDIQKICFEGSTVELNRTDNMLLSILIVSVAAFRVYMQEVGIEPAFLAGHSLGEYTALTCSGSIDFSAALNIVRQRSNLAQQVADAGNSAMTVVNKINEDIVRQKCEDVSKKGQVVSVACYNAPEQMVISGCRDAVMEVEDLLMGLGGQITPLLISPPFHCNLLEDVSVQLKEIIKISNIRRPRWPIIFNATALPCMDTEKIIENMTLQMTKPVLWKSVIDYIENEKVNKIIEIGPGAVLTNLIDMNGKKIPAISFGQKDDREKLLKTLSVSKQVTKNTENTIKPTVVTRCMAIAVCTRNTNWDDEEYRKYVEEPYEAIERIQDELDANGEEPTFEQMEAALNMLKSVFKTKRTPIEERIRRFNQIFEETGTKDLFQNFRIIDGE